MAKSRRIRKIQLAGYGADIRRARIAMAIATAGSVLGAVVFGAEVARRKPMSAFFPEEQEVVETLRALQIALWALGALFAGLFFIARTRPVLATSVGFWTYAGIFGAGLVANPASLFTVGTMVRALVLVLLLDGMIAARRAARLLRSRADLETPPPLGG